jgi:hypothetical protein
MLCSFSHVLGIDGDLLNITAAKELKAHGELCFRPLTAAAEWADAAGVDDGRQQQEEEGEVFVVRVPDVIDRDRVRCVLLGVLLGPEVPLLEHIWLTTSASCMDALYHIPYLQKSERLTVQCKYPPTPLQVPFTLGAGCKPACRC